MASLPVGSTPTRVPRAGATRLVSASAPVCGRRSRAQEDAIIGGAYESGRRHFPVIPQTQCLPGELAISVLRGEKGIGYRDRSRARDRHRLGCIAIVLLNRRQHQLQGSANDTSNRALLFDAAWRGRRTALEVQDVPVIDASHSQGGIP